MKTLRLTLKKKWFDMVFCGTKTEEYRTPSQWIESRLLCKTYDAVEFKNGYGAGVPSVTVKYLGWHKGPGFEAWGAESGREYYVIRLGEIIERKSP